MSTHLGGSFGYDFTQPQFLAMIFTSWFLKILKIQKIISLFNLM
jgi:hypothetical protein